MVGFCCTKKICHRGLNAVDADNDTELCKERKKGNIFGSTNVELLKLSLIKLKYL